MKFDFILENTDYDPHKTRSTFTVRQNAFVNLNHIKILLVYGANMHLDILSLFKITFKISKDLPHLWLDDIILTATIEQLQC